MPRGRPPTTSGASARQPSQRRAAMLKRAAESAHSVPAPQARRRRQVSAAAGRPDEVDHPVCAWDLLNQTNPNFSCDERAQLVQPLRPTVGRKWTQLLLERHNCSCTLASLIELAGSSGDHVLHCEYARHRVVRPIGKIFTRVSRLKMFSFDIFATIDHFFSLQ